MNRHSSSHKRRVTEVKSHVFEGAISGIQLMQTAIQVEGLQMSGDEVFVVRKGAKYLGLDFKWKMKKPRDPKGFFFDTRFFSFDDAFEAMVSCTDYQDRFSIVSNSFFSAAPELPCEMKVGWSNPLCPVFEGVLDELIQDEYVFPLTNFLTSKGFQVWSTDLVKYDDLDIDTCSETLTFTPSQLTTLGLPVSFIPLSIYEDDEGVNLMYMVKKGVAA